MFWNNFQRGGGVYPKSQPAIKIYILKSKKSNNYQSLWVFFLSQLVSAISHVVPRRFHVVPSRPMWWFSEEFSPLSCGTISKWVYGFKDYLVYLVCLFSCNTLLPHLRWITPLVGCCNLTSSTSCCTCSFSHPLPFVAGPHMCWWDVLLPLGSGYLFWLANYRLKFPALWL